MCLISLSVSSKSLPHLRYRPWHKCKLQNLMLVVVLSMLIPSAKASDIEISCLFVGNSSVFHQDSVAHLCCNYSQLARYSPSVFIAGALQGVSTVEEPGCRIVYVLHLFSYHDGLEIAVGYGLNPVGRWNATLHVDSVKHENVASSADYSYKMYCSPTASLTVETTFPLGPDIDRSHSSSQGKSDIWIATGVGVGVGVGFVLVICVVITLIMIAVYKKGCLKKPVTGFSSEGDTAGHKASKLVPVSIMNQANRTP